MLTNTLTSPAATRDDRALAAAILAAGRELVAERREEAAIARVRELWPGARVVRITDKQRGNP